MAVLGYDKRGVGGSTGNWNTASFDDLADDVVAAFEYLKTRSDVDSRRIGLLGVSQAGWIMPLAAVRAKDLAFLISISGAGIPAAETTIDQAQNEMTARGMRPQAVEQIVGLMKLQYHFARTGQGWDQYAATREKLAARMAFLLFGEDSRRFFVSLCPRGICFAALTTKTRRRKDQTRGSLGL